MERYALCFLATLQGGGVYVDSGGVAYFQDCNIHENTASYVCLHLRTFLELSSIAPMELNLALAIRRAVASMLTSVEWLTLKAATSMTTPLIMCACILNFP